MGNDTLASMAYANPIGFIATHLPGTPERLAVARAHDEAQVRLFLPAMSLDRLADFST